MQGEGRGARSPGTTRRGFLGGLLGLAGASATLGSLAQLRPQPALALADGTASFFEPHEREILARVVERMVGAGEDGAPALTETGAVDTLERFLAGLPPELTAPLPALLRLVDWAPPLFELQFRRFSRMEPEARDRSLRGWMESRFALRRQAFQALRNLSFLAYYSQEESWRAIGYAGPLLRAPASPGAS